MRKILHIDMDAFYASVEQRDHPKLRGKPVIVGGQPNSRGVVCAASYEARRFGVRSAMPCRHAYERCPQGIFIKPRFDRYREISGQVMSIFREYTDLVEPLSLDEAYLDVTENFFGISLARDCAQEIRQKIFSQTGCTASAGAAPNKFLAKIASDMRKPNGLMVIAPPIIEMILEHLPVRKVPGIGPVTEKKMKAMGIHTVGELKQRSKVQLIDRFGKSGSWYYQVARGIDDRAVKPRRKRKSISCERTFERDFTDIRELEKKLFDLSEELLRRCQSKGLMGSTLTLKITYSDFQKVSRSHTPPKMTPMDRMGESAENLWKMAKNLLQETEAGYRPIRLLGLGFSNLNRNGESPSASDSLQLDWLQRTET